VKILRYKSNLEEALQVCESEIQKVIKREGSKSNLAAVFLFERSKLLIL
jgi:hypothetical protein